MLKKILKAGFGGAGAQAINLLALPVIARLYEPEAFAAWAVVMAVSGLVGGISCFRYELAIVIPDDHEKAAALFWLCLISSVGMAMTAALLLYMVWHAGFLQGGGVIGLRCYTILTPLMVFTMGWSLALRYWHVRCGNFTLNSLSMLGLSIVSCTVQTVYAVLLSGSYFGLLVGSLAGQMAVVLILSLGCLKGCLPYLNHAIFKQIIEVCCIHKRFFQYSTPYALFGMLRSRAPVLVLEAFLSSREVGLYAFAYRIMYFPLSLVSGALRPVIFKVAATDGVKAVENQINKILALLAFMITPVIVVYFFYADDLFRIFFGPKWIGAGHIGKFIIVPIFAFLFCGWMDRILDVLGYQRLMLVMELFFAGSSITVLWGGLEFGWGLNGALLLQCIILTSYAITYLFLAYDRAGYRKNSLVKVGGMVIGTGLFAWVIFKSVKTVY